MLQHDKTELLKDTGSTTMRGGRQGGRYSSNKTSGKLDNSKKKKELTHHQKTPEQNALQLAAREQQEEPEGKAMAEHLGTTVQLATRA